MSKRADLLAAIARASDAVAEVSALVLEIDAEEWGAVEEQGASTEERAPFALDDRDTDRPPPPSEPTPKAHPIFSHDRLVRHVLTAHERETTPEGKESVRRAMRKLVAMGMCDARDFTGCYGDDE